MRAILCLACFLFLSACATGGFQSSTAWQGQSADVLMQQKGAPNVILPASNGNTLLVYTTVRLTRYPSSGQVNPSTFVTKKGTVVAANLPPTSEQSTMKTILCTTTYEINKQHSIVSVFARGPQC